MPSERLGAGTGLLASLLLLLAFVSLGPSAVGYHVGMTKAVDTQISETVTLPVNNWSAYRFTLGTGDTLTYDIRVMNGSAIDAYFVPEDGLVNYASDTAVSFRFYHEVSNRRNITGVFGDVSGVVVVIVDNVDIVTGGANPTGPVTVSVVLTKIPSSFPGFLLGAVVFIVCGVVLLAAALIAVFLLRRRKAAAPPPPVPYGAPPPYPYGPPPPATTERVAAPEVVRVPCKYCGTLVDSTARTCPSCNAPMG